MNTRIYVRASTKEQDAERELDDIFSSIETAKTL